MKDDIEELKKYKEMWEEISNEILSDQYEDIYGMPTRRGSIYKRYSIIKKKYFPEPIMGALKQAEDMLKTNPDQFPTPIHRVLTLLTEEIKDLKKED